MEAEARRARGSPQTGKGAAMSNGDEISEQIALLRDLHKRIFKGEPTFVGLTLKDAVDSLERLVLPHLQRVPAVYLAGGMRSNWQDRVKEAVLASGKTQVLFIDPREHHCKDEVLYTRWDLEGIRRADIIFGYLEKDNPNGAGLALEVGFARGLCEVPGVRHKQVLWVEDPQFPMLRYFGMARVCADQTFNTLEQGIEGLIKLLA